jgi:hypothetical protein
MPFCHRLTLRRYPGVCWWHEPLLRLFNRFRLVQCQLDLLEEDFFEHEIKRTLESLPTGLYQTYDKILERITRASKTDRILRILTSLAFSIRPLTICEIENVLRITPQEKVRLHEQDSPANKEQLVRRII